jgi:hypothetical protein
MTQTMQNDRQLARRWAAISAALAAAALALGGCEKKEPAGAAAGGDGAVTCASAIAKAVRALPAGTSPAAGDVQSQLAGALTTRCTEDKWPASVIKCYDGATGMAAMTACRKQLAPELAERAVADIRAAMMAGAAAMGAAHGAAAAGAAAAGAAAAGAGAAGAAAAGAAAAAAGAAGAAGSAAAE